VKTNIGIGLKAIARSVNKVKLVFEAWPMRVVNSLSSLPTDETHITSQS